jgi:hypothetical protein
MRKKCKQVTKITEYSSGKVVTKIKKVCKPKKER